MVRRKGIVHDFSFKLSTAHHFRSGQASGKAHNKVPFHPLLASIGARARTAKRYLLANRDRAVKWVKCVK
jgi:hypothetical protein